MIVRQIECLTNRANTDSLNTVLLLRVLFTRFSSKSLCLISALLVGALLTGVLSGCHQPPDETATNAANTATDETLSNTAIKDNTNPDNSHNVSHDSSSQQPLTEQQKDSISPPIPTFDEPIEIDWALIASPQARVDPSTFDYPFDLDSPSVTAYAQFFNISAQEAQHSLTVGTASNEPLTQLLDQLGQHYLSHRLVDGANVTLVVTTTPNVSPSNYDYIIENSFAKGLVLPIIIEPSQ